LAIVKIKKILVLGCGLNVVVRPKGLKKTLLIYNHKEKMS